MKEKEFKIEIPEGYEIDKEKSTFEKIVFKKKDNEYPKTWKECIEKLNSKLEEFYCIGNYSDIFYIDTPIINMNSSNYNLLPSKEIAEKFLILQKLYTCRQAYIGDWKPDWTNADVQKYVIKAPENELIISIHYCDNRSFSFPTFEMSTEFLRNFNDDLEKIKDFL